MAAEKPAAKIRRNFFAFFFRTAAEKIIFFYFSDIWDKLLRTQKVGSESVLQVERLAISGHAIPIDTLSVCIAGSPPFPP